jgi:hypothetical protein
VAALSDSDERFRLGLATFSMGGKGKEGGVSGLFIAAAGAGMGKGINRIEEGN